jgi:hypothetical protein
MQWERDDQRKLHCHNDGNYTNGNIYANGNSNSNCSGTFTPPSSQTIDVQKPVVYILAESDTTRMVLSCTRQVRFGSQCEGLNPGTFNARIDDKGHFEVEGLKGKKEEWIRFDVVQQSAIQHPSPAQPRQVSEPAAATIEAPVAPTLPGSGAAPANSGFATHWKSMTSGVTFVLRFSGDYIYVEAILPEAAAKAGAFVLSELKRDSATGGYVGKSNLHLVNENGSESCNFSNLIELTLVTPDRIEGRQFAPPRGSKGNWKTCEYADPKEWQQFSWIPIKYSVLGASCVKS